MVRISEIPTDPPPNPQPTEPAAPNPNEPAGPIELPQPPKTPNDYALRVAYIMRSYLSIRPSATSSPTADPSQDRCKAMMEVVRTETAKWSVTKVVLEHSHDTTTAVDPTKSGILPAVGMEFESLSMAKAFYVAFSEKMGFKVKAGAGRRSKGTRMLMMQRFFCEKGGSFLDVEAKTKKGGCKKSAEGEAAAAAEKNVGVAELDGNEERGSTENTGGNGGGVGEVGKEKLVEEGGGKLMESKMLRELGIRVSKYTNEERRDIIMKYMKKRNSRQVVDRSIKFPSRQALAGRRQRGFGGKFLSKEESEIVNRQEEPVEEEPEVPPEVIANAGGAPVVGMLFDNEDKAYEYYINYAGDKGFSVRKGWWDKSARNVTRSRVYVCSREGFRPKNATNETRKSRPETRTGCSARMAIKVSSTGKYRVTEFVPEHNHQLAAPLDIQMLTSQRPLLKSQTGGTQQNSSLIPSGYKNYLRAKRMIDMKAGDARAILEYLQKMKGKNPSFYYAIQVDEDDQITNVFWADARSMTDYYYFGDVVCFDTSYKGVDFGRPFAQFIGVNHHQQAITFGAAFLYDESVESFKWLFETFKMAMSGKQPKTILTDQFPPMGDAIAVVWPGTAHRFCVWQIYQNATKHLSNAFQSSETFGHDFSRCLYDFEVEEEFLSAWKSMIEKYDIKDNEWLCKLFEEREKWATVYGRQAFSADLQRTLRSENVNSFLKEHPSQEMDLSSFFKKYERLVDEGRYTELQADYNANQDTPRIPPVRLLWQAASAYTPVVFEMFRKEFELFMDCMAFSCGEVGTLSQYEVTVKGKSRPYYVRFDSSDGTVLCTCCKFDSVGIQCCHVLKVLESRNIKELPPRCILKRWRKDAKSGFAFDTDHNSSVSKRYNALCRMLYKIAEKASDNIDAFTLMVSQSDQLLEQVERILQTKLLEKSTLSNASKGQAANSVEGQNVLQDSNNESPQASGKRKKDGGGRLRHQNGLEMNIKRQRVRKGKSNETVAAAGDTEPPMVSNDDPSQLRNPSNHFFAPSILIQGAAYNGCHQFGLGPAQVFQTMPPFGQDSSASALQQSFHVGAHLNQNTMPGFPTPDMHQLQFVGSNPQLDPQSSDQGQCAIPVWDFL